ncbi:unnamed protein product [Amoebophrya sp. A120]|nr:unnamed protein product [Amoebophrya sp. A120]|eukprot:GSA120T00008012001.1
MMNMQEQKGMNEMCRVRHDQHGGDTDSHDPEEGWNPQECNKDAVVVPQPSSFSPRTRPKQGGRSSFIGNVVGASSSSLDQPSPRAAGSNFVGSVHEEEKQDHAPRRVEVIATTTDESKGGRGSEKGTVPAATPRTRKPTGRNGTSIGKNTGASGSAHRQASCSVAAAHLHRKQEHVDINQEITARTATTTGSSSCQSKNLSCAKPSHSLLSGELSPPKTLESFLGSVMQQPAPDSSFEPAEYHHLHEAAKKTTSPGTALSQSPASGGCESHVEQDVLKGLSPERENSNKNVADMTSEVEEGTTRTQQLAGLKGNHFKELDAPAQQDIFSENQAAEGPQNEDQVGRRPHKMIMPLSVSGTTSDPRPQVPAVLPDMFCATPFYAMSSEEEEIENKNNAEIESDSGHSDSSGDDLCKIKIPDLDEFDDPTPTAGQINYNAQEPKPVVSLLDLPDDLIADQIFTKYLNLQMVSRCAAVCTQLNFVVKQFCHPYLEMEELRVLATLRPIPELWMPILEAKPVRGSTSSSATSLLSNTPSSTFTGVSDQHTNVNNAWARRLRKVATGHQKLNKIFKPWEVSTSFIEGSTNDKHEERPAATSCPRPTTSSLGQSLLFLEKLADSMSLVNEQDKTQQVEVDYLRRMALRRAAVRTFIRTWIGGMTLYAKAYEKHLQPNQKSEMEGHLIFPHLSARSRVKVACYGVNVLEGEEDEEQNIGNTHSKNLENKERPAFHNAVLLSEENGKIISTSSSNMSGGLDMRFSPLQDVVLKLEMEKTVVGRAGGVPHDQAEQEINTGGFTSSSPLITSSSSSAVGVAAEDAPAVTSSKKPPASRATEQLIVRVGIFEHDGLATPSTSRENNIISHDAHSTSASAPESLTSTAHLQQAEKMVSAQQKKNWNNNFSKNKTYICPPSAQEDSFDVAPAGTGALGGVKRKIGEDSGKSSCSGSSAAAGANTNSSGTRTTMNIAGTTTTMVDVDVDGQVRKDVENYNDQAGTSTNLSYMLGFTDEIGPAGLPFFAQNFLQIQLSAVKEAMKNLDAFWDRELAQFVCEDKGCTKAKPEQMEHVLQFLLLQQEEQVRETPALFVLPQRKEVTQAYRDWLREKLELLSSERLVDPKEKEEFFKYAQAVFFREADYLHRESAEDLDDVMIRAAAPPPTGSSSIGTTRADTSTASNNSTNRTTRETNFDYGLSADEYMEKMKLEQMEKAKETASAAAAEEDEEISSDGDASDGDHGDQDERAQLPGRAGDDEQASKPAKKRPKRASNLGKKEQGGGEVDVHTTTTPHKNKMTDWYDERGHLGQLYEKSIALCRKTSAFLPNLLLLLRNNFVYTEWTLWADTALNLAEHLRLTTALELLKEKSSSTANYFSQAERERLAALPEQIARFEQEVNPVSAEDCLARAWLIFSMAIDPKSYADRNDAFQFHAVFQVSPEKERGLGVNTMKRGTDPVPASGSGLAPSAPLSSSSRFIQIGPETTMVPAASRTTTTGGAGAASSMSQNPGGVMGYSHDLYGRNTSNPPRTNSTMTPTPSGTSANTNHDSASGSRVISSHVVSREDTAPARQTGTEDTAAVTTTDVQHSPQEQQPPPQERVAFPDENYDDEYDPEAETKYMEWTYQQEEEYHFNVVTEKVRLLQKFFMENNYRGCESHLYYSVQNSLCHKVVDLRRGNPIALCTFLGNLASQQGLLVEYLPHVPGHVFIRIDGYCAYEEVLGGTGKENNFHSNNNSTTPAGTRIAGSGARSSGGNNINQNINFCQTEQQVSLEASLRAGLGQATSDHGAGTVQLHEDGDGNYMKRRKKLQHLLKMEKRIFIDPHDPNCRTFASANELREHLLRQWGLLFQPALLQLKMPKIMQVLLWVSRLVKNLGNCDDSGGFMREAHAVEDIASQVHTGLIARFQNDERLRGF